MGADATRHDTAPIAIVGGGPIGLVCALLLAARGFRSIVLDARTVDAARADPRLLALSLGTWDVLDPLLDAATRPRTAPITDVHVSSAGEFGATHLSTRDFADPSERSRAPAEALGATVTYGDLLQALAARASAQPLIEMRRPVRVAGFAQQPQRVVVTLDGAGDLVAPLVVHAEGTGDRTSSADVRAWAVLADVAVDGPAAGDAFERFTREGPLALLPTPNAAPAFRGRAFSLVWCMRADAARRRAALDDAAFVAELQAAIGSRIGAVRGAGPRRAVPLPSHLRERIREHRCVWLGNAAQSLHPVAGQGFNLGVRDCATLARCLAESRDDAMIALGRYEALRRADRRAIETITRWLPGLFATTFTPVRAARSLGLAMLDVLPAARREFARLLMFGVRA